MASRALIIAIENYPNAKGLPTSLPGTLASAQAFRKWLVDEKQMNPANIRFCTDSKCPEQTADATREVIVDQLVGIVKDGKDNTEEFYFFFSGHGFSYQDVLKKKPADVLVAQEFQTLDTSGLACFKLDDVRLKLWQAMGPGDHYYFIDACRNNINTDDVDVAPLGRGKGSFPASSLKRPTSYTLYSANRGAAAAVASGFGSILIDGLGGRGRAKAWIGNRMFVTFESLFDFLKDNLQQHVDRSLEGDGAGLIREMLPVPRYECAVEIKNAIESDQFTLTVNDSRGRALESRTFTGSKGTFTQVPDDYDVQVTHASAIVERLDTPPARLYEDSTVTFQKIRRKRGGTQGTPIPATVPVRVSAVPGASLVIRNIQNGERIEAENQFVGKLSPGRYELMMMEDKWTVVRRQELVLSPGQALVHIDLKALDVGTAGGSVIRALPIQARPDDQVWLSETLSPTSDADLGLWLSIIGGSRVFGSGEFSKLTGFDLETFDDVKKGDAPVYLLLGGDGLKDTVVATLDQDSRQMRRVPNLLGIHEQRWNLSPGPHLLSVSLSSPVGLATYSVPNRATLVVVTMTPEGAPSIYQHMLPLESLVKYLSAEVQSLLPTDAYDVHHVRPTRLAGIKLAAQAQRLFAQRRAVEPPRGTESFGYWGGILHAKWLDPMLGLLASYELIRQGRFVESGIASTMIKNLRQYVPGLPDTEVIAELAGLPHSTRASVPLFLDGTLALGEPGLLPLPEGALDYSGMWTMWRTGKINGRTVR